MIEKLLKHLTNAPVAVALAFLLVGAPAAPVAKMLPEMGEAQASGAFCRSPYDGRPDSDCDGLPDTHDPCPTDPDLYCGIDAPPPQTSPDVGMSASDHVLCLMATAWQASGLVYGIAGFLIPEPFVSKVLSISSFALGGVGFIVELALC